MSYDAAPSCRLGSYALGLLFIFLVSCSWAGASVLLQYIYQDLAFDSPFIITYVCTSLFAIYLPWVYACGRLGIGQNPPFYDDPDSLPIAEAASLSSSAPSLSLSRAEASRGGALPLDHQPLKGPTSDEPDHVRTCTRSPCFFASTHQPSPIIRCGVCVLCAAGAARAALEPYEDDAGGACDLPAVVRGELHLQPLPRHDQRHQQHHHLHHLLPLDLHLQVPYNKPGRRRGTACRE